MHPLETTAPKMDGLPVEQIEKLDQKSPVYLSLESFNKLPSKARHTASDLARFAYLPTFGGWKCVRLV